MQYDLIIRNAQLHRHSRIVDIAVKNNAIVAGIPHRLFEVSLQPTGPRNRWVVTPDGKKFLAVVPVDQKPVHNFTVILNWPSLLPRR